MIKQNMMNVEPLLKTVAANIKDRRLSLSLSQNDMAARLHVTQNAYCKMETAKTKLSVARLFEIAEVLEIAPIKLVTMKVVPMHPVRKVG